MGCSHQSVPSLSNVAMRSSGSTNSGLPSLDTFSTNAMIDCLAGHSFHDGSGSSARTAWKDENTQVEISISAVRRMQFNMLCSRANDCVRSNHQVRQQERGYDHGPDPETEQDVHQEQVPP